MGPSRNSRPISWIKAARRDFETFPEGAQREILRALTIAAEGQRADIAKPLKGLGSGVWEVALRYRTDAYRTVYALGDPCVPEEIDARAEDACPGNRAGPGSTEPAAKGVESVMRKEDDFGVVRGSGNVFHDLGHANADVEQTKAILAAQIIAILESEGLSTRSAQERTGVNHADFARIRKAKLDRFTIDRLMTILNQLGRRVDVKVTIERRPAEEVEIHP